MAVAAGLGECEVVESTDNIGPVFKLYRRTLGAVMEGNKWMYFLPSRL